MAVPIEVTLSLDLDKHLASLKGYDSEGDPIEAPTTVEAVVLGMAADRLIEQMARSGYDWRSDLARRVASVRDDMIAAALRPDVEAALLAPVQKTSNYGDPLGAPTTVRDLIVAKVEEWLTSANRDSYKNPRGLTKPQEIIAGEVDRAMGKEMKDAIDAAKAEVVAAVQAKGAEIMAQTIAKLAGGS